MSNTTDQLQQMQNAANDEAQSRGADGACGFELADGGVAFYSYGEQASGATNDSAADDSAGS